MAQADAEAVDVCDLLVKPQFLFLSQVLGGKGLVDFDQLEAVDDKAGIMGFLAAGMGEKHMVVGWQTLMEIDLVPLALHLTSYHSVKIAHF